jgi:ribokinase
LNKVFQVLVTTFLNAAPYRQLSLEDELFQLTDIICTNENETELLVGHPLQTLRDYEEAALKLLEYGPKFVIVTLGAEGAIVAEKGRVQKVEALKVDAVDTTVSSFC